MVRVQYMYLTKKKDKKKTTKQQLAQEKRARKKGQTPLETPEGGPPAENQTTARWVNQGSSEFRRMVSTRRNPHHSMIPRDLSERDACAHRAGQMTQPPRRS